MPGQQNQGLYSQERDEKGMTGRQRAVLAALTGKNPDGTETKRLNQMEVADQLGISRQRVRQIVTDLLDKGFEIPGVKPKTHKTTGVENATNSNAG